MKNTNCLILNLSLILSLSLLTGCLGNPLGSIAGGGSTPAGFHPGLPAAAPTSSVLSVSAISPTNGTATGGTALTITGVGFTAGDTVKLGNSSCTSVTVVSSSSITCVSPAQAAATVTVTVTRPGGTSASLSSAYTYLSAGTPGYIATSGGKYLVGTHMILVGGVLGYGSPAYQSSAHMKQVPGYQGVALIPGH